MKAFPVLGVALIAVLLGGGLYYLEEKPAAPAAPAGYEPEPAPVAAATVAFRVLEAGATAAKVDAPKYYAAYSQEALARLWSLAHGADGTALPSVDFAKEYVIGVFAGKKPTGGYVVKVTGVADAGATRTISVTLAKPGEGCITTQAFTSPYQIIAVPVSDANLAHTDAEVSEPCI